MRPPPEPVAWDVAEQVAGKVAGRTDTRVDWATLRGLVTDFQEVTAQAEELVERLDGPAVARRARPGRRSPPGRNGSTPTSPRSGACSARCSSAPARAAAACPGCSARWAGWPPGPRWASCSGGCPAGFSVSTTCCSPRATRPQDAVYYVGPNIVSLERRHGFDPREFRLWIALHELTHRAQFTGVPWLRAHFLDLVERSVAIASPDPRQLLDALGRMAVDIRSGRNPLAESGSRRGLRVSRAARDAALDPGDDEPSRRSR